MYSSNENRQRKEKILYAHKLLLLLDSTNFGGVVRFSYKKDEGIMTYVLEEHGSFNGNCSPKPVIEEIKKII